ncbi:MAG: hypothetical protein WCJ73_07500, partial [Actinomycetes bacterium]
MSDATRSGDDGVLAEVLNCRCTHDSSNFGITIRQFTPSGWTATWAFRSNASQAIRSGSQEV